jgi:putative membrane protein
MPKGMGALDSQEPHNENAGRAAAQTSGDDARVRDHLANERTSLAWTRTGIALMGFGLVIARLRYLFPPNALTPPSRGLIHASNLGLVFTIVGLLTVVLSAWRYRVVQKELREQRYRSSQSLVMVFTAIIALLGLLILWYLVQSSVETQ